MLKGLLPRSDKDPGWLLSVGVDLWPVSVGEFPFFGGNFPSNANCVFDRLLRCEGNMKTTGCYAYIVNYEQTTMLYAIYVPSQKTASRLRPRMKLRARIPARKAIHWYIYLVWTYGLASRSRRGTIPISKED